MNPLDDLDAKWRAELAADYPRPPCFSMHKPRCRECGQRSIHWAGCPNDYQDVTEFVGPVAHVSIPLDNRERRS